MCTCQKHIRGILRLMDDEIAKFQSIIKAREGLEMQLFTTAGSRKAKKYYEEYRKPGIETEPFLKLAFLYSRRINYRNHRKSWLSMADRLCGRNECNDRYIHGFEWGNWRFTRSHRRKGGTGLQSAFLIDWYFVSQTLITSRKYFPRWEFTAITPCK